MKPYQQTNDFNEIIYGRRSIKTYDSSVKISREEMTQIINEASTAPSSINMQPWRFLVVDTPEGKENSFHCPALTKKKSLKLLLSLPCLRTKTTSIMQKTFMEKLLSMA